MQKTLTIEGVDYVVATLKTHVNKNLKYKNDDGSPRDAADFNVDFVVESLRAGGALDPESVVENLDDGTFDLASPYKQILAAAMEVNGYKTGEVPAGESPASTGPSSIPA